MKEPFRKRFTVGPEDMSPVDTAAWRLGVPRVGARQPLVVTFPEALDHALLLRALVVEDERGEPVGGAAEVGLGETEWTFTPDRPWTPGGYALVALGILEDLAGNRIGAPFEIDVFERIDEPDEQDVYRITFQVTPGS